jgi:signal transduction histidine kinase
MAKRLSHEIRTPIAVVSSSLDNLQLTKVSEESQIYIDRAQDGIKRLNHILTNMGEATRLEQILQKTEKEYFQLSVLLEGCIEGYRAIYPQQRFLLETAPKEITIHGCPELIAQLLDKLISNAVEFARLDTPIRIRSYSLASHNVSIEVINQGPLLPDTMQHRLFDSMVSVRSEAKSEAPHLGLGLYIARLISDFHQATLTAQNLDDQSGVCFRLTLSAETSA